MTRTEVPSPCIRQCALDDNQVCLGCGRTLDEIRRWAGMANEEKAQVWQRLRTTCEDAERLRSLKAADPRA